MKLSKSNNFGEILSKLAQAAPGSAPAPQAQPASKSPGKSMWYGKDLINPDAIRKSIEEKRKAQWEQGTKALAKEMESVHGVLNTLLGAPMVARDKQMVAYINQFRGMLDHDAVLKNPALVPQVIQGTRGLQQYLTDFTKRWQSATQKGEAYLADARQRIGNFHKFLATLPVMPAPMPTQPMAPNQQPARPIQTQQPAQRPAFMPTWNYMGV